MSSTRHVFVVDSKNLQRFTPAAVLILELAAAFAERAVTDDDERLTAIARKLDDICTDIIKVEDEGRVRMSKRCASEALMRLNQTARRRTVIGSVTGKSRKRERN